MIYEIQQGKVLLMELICWSFQLIHVGNDGCRESRYIHFQYFCTTMLFVEKGT